MTNFSMLNIKFGMAYYKNEPFTGITRYHNNIFYYKNGVLHREDGPAVIYYNKAIEYWIDGKKLKRIIKILKINKFKLR